MHEHDDVCWPLLGDFALSLHWKHVLCVLTPNSWALSAIPRDSLAPLQSTATDDMLVE
jgi:hypothetical protein